MAPKRKAATTAAASKKAKKQPAAAAAEPPPPAAAAAAPVPAPAPASAKKAKPLKSMGASDVWQSADYVSGGRMTQETFAAFLTAVGIELMTFDALYLSFRLAGPDAQTVENAWTVCASKQALQGALDGLGCKSMGELPDKLRRKCATLEASFGEPYQAFFRWLFEMGKAIQVLNSDSVHAANVRTVPLDVGLSLLEGALSSWALKEQFKAFCEQQHKQPFSKDLWNQIGRFAHMHKTGQIAKDLSNYDDESGGGSAWPCAIDDFVEFVQAAAE